MTIPDTERCQAANILHLSRCRLRSGHRGQHIDGSLTYQGHTVLGQRMAIIDLPLRCSGCSHEPHAADACQRFAFITHERCRCPYPSEEDV